MSRTIFPAQLSVLSTQALIEMVLSKYRLQSPLECHSLTKGMNDTYTVKAGSSTYYLRVYT